MIDQKILHNYYAVIIAMIVELKQIMTIVTMRLVLADDVGNLCHYKVVLTNKRTMKMVTDRNKNSCKFYSNDNDYDSWLP